MKRFEELLRYAAERSREVRLVPMIDERGRVQFYAHIHGANSDTVDAVMIDGDMVDLEGKAASGVRGSVTANVVSAAP